MEDLTYVVRDFEKHFVKADMRKSRRWQWVAVPVKHDSRGYCRLAAHPRAPEIYCAFQLILQVSCRMPEPGVLANEDGPLDATDLAMMTRFPVDIFVDAFDALSHPKIGWLYAVSSGQNEKSSGQKAGFAGTSPDERAERGEASGDHPDYSTVQYNITTLSVSGPGEELWRKVVCLLTPQGRWPRTNPKEISAWKRLWGRLGREAIEEGVEALEPYYAAEKATRNDETWNRKTTVVFLMNDFEAQIELAEKWKKNFSGAAASSGGLRILN